MMNENQRAVTMNEIVGLSVTETETRQDALEVLLDAAALLISMEPDLKQVAIGRLLDSIETMCAAKQALESCYTPTEQ